jgi:hypothetical protein
VIDNEVNYRQTNVNLVLFVKVKLSHSLINQVPQLYEWRSGGLAQPFLTSSLDGNEMSASRLRRSTLGKITPCIHCVGVWVDSRVGLNTMEYIKTVASNGNRSPNFQQLTSRYTDCVFPTRTTLLVHNITFGGICWCECKGSFLLVKFPSAVLMQHKNTWNCTYVIEKKSAWYIFRVSLCPLYCCRQLLAPNLVQKHFLASGAEQVSKQVKYCTDT